MPEVAALQFIPGSNLVVTQDLWANIDIELHAHSPELGTTIQAMVRDITPIRTGALLQDITSYPNTAAAGIGAGQSTLVEVKAADVAQQAFWHRYYAPYQEGGVLGLPTYTNPAREMFFTTATTDGLDATVLWAMDYIGEAIRKSVSGGGKSFPVPFGLGLIKP